MKEDLFFSRLKQWMATLILLDLCNVQPCWAWYTAVSHKREKIFLPQRMLPGMQLPTLYYWFVGLREKKGSIVFPLATYV